MRFTTLKELLAHGTVASISDGLELLVSLYARPQAAREMLDADLARRCYRPEWCRLALDDDGNPVAALAWWARPETAVPMLVDLFGATNVDAAAELIIASRTSLVLRSAECWLGVRGAADVRETYPIELPALQAAGFVPAVDRVRLRRPAGTVMPPLSGRLAFRPAAAFTDQELVDIFVAVGDGSLDHHMRVDRIRDGAEAEARHRLERTTAMSGPADWFVIGLEAAGTPVGYVRAAYVSGRAPVLAEIGVVQSMRGRRYVDDLLAYGTQLLVDAGASRIGSATDLANIPMRKAFQRAGYAEFARRYDYEWRA
jgi:RimJ/RimL family protein N-acetyltransferase